MLFIDNSFIHIVIVTHLLKSQFYGHVSSEVKVETTRRKTSAYLLLLRLSAEEKGDFMR